VRVRPQLNNTRSCFPRSTKKKGGWEERKARKKERKEKRGTATLLLAPAWPFLDGRRCTMEQINTQVSDLRYLAQGPVALSETATSNYGTPRPHTHGSPGSASIGDNSALPMSDDAGTGNGDGSGNGNGNGGGNKRKSAEDGTPAGKQTRSKRNRVSRGEPLSLPPLARRWSVPARHIAHFFFPSCTLRQVEKRCDD
jgi:hypothetical protein